MKVPAGWWDYAAAVVVLAAMEFAFFDATFRHPESDNTIAYSLPAANLVTGGALRIPQLGSQMGLDRTWLLNSPLMAAGQAPLFLAFGVRRYADLFGVFALWQINVAVYWLLIRKALGFRSWAVPLALSFAVLGNRGVLAELFNQRYSSPCFALVALAFLPTAGVRPWWQWLAAGLMPLAHPSLILAYAGWLVWEAWRCRSLRSQSEAGVSPAGLGCFVVAAALTLAWYGRWDAFRAQFLSHLRYGNFRGGQTLTGLRAIPASPAFAFPSLATNVAFVALAWGVVLACLRPDWRRRLAPVLPAAALVVAVFPIDLFRGFLYYNYYFLGAGAVALYAFESWTSRRTAASVLAGLALMNAATAVKLGSAHPSLVDTPQTIDFLVEHTRSGDRIVTGPPFVLAAARTDLPGGRTIPRVVPAPYFLEDFREPVFRNDVERSADVYVGFESWYVKAMGYHVTGPPKPLFPDAEIRRFRFDGRNVIVARKAAGTP